ncbi:hypothetical protein CANTEDRAFT_107261 [Yamadazyma tenuis ATCC 10573]|uniref:Major facilitator superfamily (MFS) profile domain-containing protein n=1 Tax=Candida tenuis (strain ATCC 10573 / BCRC 21748 / CBS 615 / JCM 9827 / NBRC 10315 / NRRL Y-1498 / VKM Y-70) TaxID=590646 RepID=G3BAE7_CANTC|nr:uncharacterized protein CANTEDRAFT_107261 [Yamadazyma tenuis ATCC 10573]EGV62043.1 hypothetical protein CANTEDRAFT_107261 [Yamadazyma tenuis ATCC 10573]
MGNLNVDQIVPYEIDELQQQNEKKINQINVTRAFADLPVPFSIYSALEKYLLMLIIAMIGFWGTVSPPSFFPAIPTIESYFNVSETVANLSVVSYLILQGVAPTFSSNISDSIGRRPIVILCLLIYIGATIALSQTNVFWLLVLLRCVQAAGIGPTTSITAGFSGDICTEADRGSFVGIVMGMQLTGQAFGSIIGSGLIHSYGWRGIFVFCAIGSGITLIGVIFLLPETVRSIAGNGSVRPKRVINIAPILLLKPFSTRLTNQVETLAPVTQLSLLSPFRILFRSHIIYVLFSPAIKFAVWSMTLTSLTLLEGDGYDYSVLKVGYMYLPQGVTCLIGSVITGRLLDWSYKRSKKAYDEKHKHIQESESPGFNILPSRIYISIIPSVLQFIGIVIFGWCLQFKLNIGSIIVGTCLISYSSEAALTISSTVLVDMYPTNASASVSLMNLTRCCISALGVGVLSKMTSSMGIGGCYTFWGAVGLVADMVMFYAVCFKKQ